jgi:hypothetical protein
LGLDPQTVLSQRGRLTNDQLRTAALSAANNTQFASSVLDLPFMRNTPQGQFIYLFKGFTMQQSRFAKDLVKDARRGDAGPLLRYLMTLATYGAGIGEVVADVRSVVRQKERPDEAHLRYWEDVTFAGGLGMFSDVLNSMARGPDAISAFVMGPAFGEAVRTAAEGYQAATGNPDQLMRHAISRIPVAGPALAQWLVP